MRILYQLLESIHPAAPTLFVVVAANGFAAVEIYRMRRKVPFSFPALRRKAQEGDVLSRYVFYSAVLLLVAVILVCLLLFVSLFFMERPHDLDIEVQQIHGRQTTSGTTGVPSLHSEVSGRCDAQPCNAPDLAHKAAQGR